MPDRDSEAPLLNQHEAPVQPREDVPEGGQEAAALATPELAPVEGAVLESGVIGLGIENQGVELMAQTNEPIPEGEPVVTVSAELSDREKGLLLVEFSRTGGVDEGGLESIAQKVEHYRSEQRLAA